MLQKILRLKWQERYFLCGWFLQDTGKADLKSEEGCYQLLVMCL